MPAVRLVLGLHPDQDRLDLLNPGIGITELLLSHKPSSKESHPDQRAGRGHLQEGVEVFGHVVHGKLHGKLRGVGVGGSGNHPRDIGLVGVEWSGRLAGWVSVVSFSCGGDAADLLWREINRELHRIRVWVLRLLLGFQELAGCG